MMLEYAYWITQGLLTVAIGCAVYRVFRGPSVLDRVISVDVMLIIVSSMLITDMVARGHQDFIMFVVATAVIGFLGAVAIARFVAVRRPEEMVAGDAPHSRQVDGSPSPGVSREPVVPHSAETVTPPGVGEDDPATSWFTALARSGYTPRRRDDRRQEGTDES